MERVLTKAEAATAADIQRAMDALATAGGRLILPAMDLTLDRGLILRSGVELTGQGERTVLRKGPCRVYPLTGYHNYGMCDVPLVSAAGLAPGMTVSIHDGRTHGSFYETFATITWVDGNWAGLDHGIEADYLASEKPCLTTAYPLIFAHGIRDAAVRNLRLEGSRETNEQAMGGCRGGAIYFASSRNIECAGVTERNYAGEGLSFQMCRDIRITDCRFNDNTGNGLHPGAGSTNVLFERCEGSRNQGAGFFFCVRANHITVRACVFCDNGLGVSIGERDCHNVLESCTIADNQGAGIGVRETPRPIEVHSCWIRNCTIRANARASAAAQVEILPDAHDLVLEGNRIIGGPGFSGAGISVAAAARNIHCADNQIAACGVQVRADAQSLATARPRIACGYGTASDQDFRHLPQPCLP